jgi:transcriptional regulator with XRE-family HTH domain
MPPNPVAVHFGENLRAARHKAGLAQEKLAKRAALHRTEIGLLERGARVPRIDTVVKVAGVLDVHPGDLLLGIEWEPGHKVAGSFSSK